MPGAVGGKAEWMANPPSNNKEQITRKPPITELWGMTLIRI